MYFDFDTEAGEKVKVGVGPSPVSQENALANMQTEVPYWNFKQVKAKAQADWNRELNECELTHRNPTR